MKTHIILLLTRAKVYPSYNGKYYVDITVSTHVTVFASSLSCSECISGCDEAECIGRLSPL